jgi:phospholipase C
MSEWRRTVCGDLTSVFRPYNGEKIDSLNFVKRDEFIKSIHQAQFKNPPSDFKRVTKEQIAQINKNPVNSKLMPVQEEGIRSACALPYELYADGHYHSGEKSFEIIMKAGNKFFHSSSAGSPFHVYAPGKYKGEDVRTWSYAVEAGDELNDTWRVADFENGKYHLRVYGPNGFYREFIGNENDPRVQLECRYDTDLKRVDLLTGDIVINVKNRGSKDPIHIEITDNAYKAKMITKKVASSYSGSRGSDIYISAIKSYGWYDFTVRIKGNSTFERRYAGRVETGAASKTDPFMGRRV